MEKTPLQQLIERLNESILTERDVLDAPNLFHPNDVKQANLLVSNVEQIISVATELLPVERDAIVEAVEKGRYMKHETGLYVTGEQYYETRYGSLK